MTERKYASVGVKNLTGTKLLRVYVTHKYSDDWVETHEWLNLEHNGATAPDLRVSYNVGWTCTGTDWWSVICYTDDDMLWTTHPQNFRDIIDFFERPYQAAANGVDAVRALVQNQTERAEQAVLKAAECVADYKGTTGLKQYVLTEKDANGVVWLEIDSKELRISSPSGKTSTGWRKERVWTRP